MSLTVSATLLEQAERGKVPDAEFVDCARHSLPYAYDVVAELAGRLPGESRDFADNLVPPPDEAARGQLLRRSRAMRSAGR